MWVNIIAPMILALANNSSQCVTLEGERYRESCGTGVLILSPESGYYDIEDLYCLTFDGNLVYNGKLDKDIIVNENWTLLDSYDYISNNYQMLYVAGYASFIGNKCEVGVYVNGVYNEGNQILHFELGPGFYTIEMKARAIEGRGCSCPSYRDGFKSGRTFSIWEEIRYLDYNSSYISM